MSANTNICDIYKKCSGCQLQNMSYEQQLIWKTGKCKKLLDKYGKVENIVGMKNPYHYRNKVQAAFTTKRDGKIVSGVFQSTKQTLVPVDSCLTEDKKCDEIVVTIRKMLKAYKLTTYNNITGKGFLRHVLIKRGFATNEVMVVLVTGTPIFPAKKHFVNELVKKHPEIKTIIHNINNKPTALVLSTNEKILYGKGFITDILCGFKFRISAKSFYQINPVQTEFLYNKAIELAQLTGKETVLDAYCGIGTIGIIASKKAGNVIGVELNRDATRDAIVNARENGIKNIYFHTADAGEFMTQMVNEPCDVVFMDPPRAGSTEEFLKSLCTLKPKTVVYISCNPETLSRDLDYLTKNKYAVKKILPVDMFPHTNHVECVVLLTKV